MTFLIILTSVLFLLCIVLALFMLKAMRSEAQIRNQATVRESELKNQAVVREAELQSEAAALHTRNDALSREIEAMEKRIEESREQMKTIVQQQEERFKNIATEILNNSTKQFNETSNQRLGDILNPLKENIETFRKVVSDTYSTDAKERASLQKELQILFELNRSIGREARDLTNALRSNSKVQGDWGEMILEQLLEKSGLIKGQHFEVQVTRNEDGKVLQTADGHTGRADVVVHYPDDRCLVIDSKVSLTDFIDFVNYSADDSPENVEKRREAGRKHVASVRQHIAELAAKGYQDVVGKKRLDFVLMFIPNESAYMAAMQLEPGLWQEAYDKRVLIVSPTHLISVLRMLSSLWKQDSINRNSEEIGRLAGLMLDKFSLVVESLDKIESSLETTRKSYSECRNRLADGKGNFFSIAGKIQALGAKNTRRLPES